MDWRTPFWGFAAIGAALLTWSAGLTAGYAAVAVFLIGCTCVLGTIGTVMTAKRHRVIATALPPQAPPPVMPTGFTSRFHNVEVSGSGGDGMVFKGDHDLEMDNVRSRDNAGRGMVFDNTPAPDPHRTRSRG